MNSNPILVIVGARPIFVKLAGLIRALDAACGPAVVVHNGQHYDDAMSDALFRSLKIREPDVNLGCKATIRVGQVAEFPAHLYN